MGMIVRTNIMAVNANNNLGKNTGAVSKSLEKLSSGFRINRAADDASGLAISEKMKAQIKALDTASVNCEDGISLIQTAEGYTGEIHDMLNRMVELAEKSSNGVMETVSGGIDKECYGGAATDRQALQDEMDQLCAEIDRIAQTANFNNLKLFNGTLQSGAVIGEGSVVINSANVDAGITADDILSFDGTDWKNGANATVDLEDYGITLNSEPTTGDTINFSVASATDVPAAETHTIANDTGFAFDGTAATATKNAQITYDNGKWVDQNGNQVTLSNYGITPPTTPTNGDTISYTAARAAGEASATGTIANENTGTCLKLQIGETDTGADKLSIDISKLTTDVIFKDIALNTTYTGTGSGLTITVDNNISTFSEGLSLNISNQDSASSVAVGVRNAINSVSSLRARLGAMQNRLEYSISNLNTASENMTSANSRIRDTDMAQEMTKYTQCNVLTQAAQAMLAQANTQPQNILQLLQ